MNIKWDDQGFAYYKITPISCNESISSAFYNLSDLTISEHKINIPDNSGYYFIPGNGQEPIGLRKTVVDAECGGNCIVDNIGTRQFDCYWIGATILTCKCATGNDGQCMVTVCPRSKPCYNTTGVFVKCNNLLKQ